MKYFKKDNIVTFYPPQNALELKHKMNSIEYCCSSFYTRGGMYFNGSIDIDRFIDAMYETLSDFNFMFIQFDRENDIGLFSSLNNNNTNENVEEKHVIKLELEYREDELVGSPSKTLDNYLPTKIIDDRMKGFAITVEGLPMTAFKLTKFSNGFTIGYYMNHAFLDQSSIYYFIKYLSFMYRVGRKETMAQLKKPDIRNLDFLYENNGKFSGLKDLPEARSLGEDLGYYYKYKNTDSGSAPESVVLDLTFNSEEIEKIKKQTTQYISTNDVIHAIILKMNALNPALKQGQEFCLKFNCNLRKLLSMSEEAIGNILYGHKYMVKVEDMKSKSILELALQSRQCLSRLTIEGFQSEANWLCYLQKYKENPLDYSGRVNPLACRVSSWLTFDYDRINFSKDGDTSTPITPYAIYSPCIAQFSNINMLTFNNSLGPKTIISSIYIPTSCLSSMEDLQKSTKLFTFKKME
eukprot:gene5575-6941_t